MVSNASRALKKLMLQALTCADFSDKLITKTLPYSVYTIRWME